MAITHPRRQSTRIWNTSATPTSLPFQDALILNTRIDAVQRFLFLQTRVLQAATADPLENGPVLVAGFVSVPALAAVVRRQVITYVAGAVGRPGGFDQHQTLVRVGDVHHAHRVAVIFFAVLIREDDRGIGWR